MYAGPLRDESLAIELSNTVYVSGGELADGLEAPQAWLEAIAPRLPAGSGAWPPAAALKELREAVRASLQPRRRHPLPRRSTRSTAPPRALRARPARRAGRCVAGTDYHGATRAEIVLAAFAADAIDLLTGPRRADLRACGAPGCVLLFLKDHPRREWCSNACGNRARQARHYQRLRA